MWLAALLIFAFDSPQQPVLSDLLSRVAEEAEILRQNAPKARLLSALLKKRPRGVRKRRKNPPLRLHMRLKK